MSGSGRSPAIVAWIVSAIEVEKKSKS